MPWSNYWHIPTVMHFANALKPMRVLDVGVGLGTYGFLMRQLTDIYYERVNKKDWQGVINGVEIFEGYRNPTWEYAYDKVFLGDIRNLIGDVGNYDLIICNDVLEHFELSKAKLLITGFLDHSDVVIATTPNRKMPQGNWGGNEAETHKCLLTASDFTELVAAKNCGVTNFYICSRSSSCIATIKKAATHAPVARPELIPVLVDRIMGIGRRAGRLRDRLLSK